MEAKPVLPGVLIVLVGLIGLAGATGAQAARVGPLATVSLSPAGGTYKGRTEDDGRIRFRLAGKRISSLRGTVPTVCLELGGSYDSRVGYELFRPPGAFTLGKTRKVKAMQTAALNGNTKATKNYTVTMRPVGRRKVRGRLKLSYVFLTFGIPNIVYLWTCSSSVTFTARRG